MLTGLTPCVKRYCFFQVPQQQDPVLLFMLVDSHEPGFLQMPRAPKYHSMPSVVRPGPSSVLKLQLDDIAVECLGGVLQVSGEVVAAQIRKRLLRRAIVPSSYAHRICKSVAKVMQPETCCDLADSNSDVEAMQ